MNKFFMSLCAAGAIFALGSCSDDEPATGGNGTPEGPEGESYVTVSIEMPTAPGSRAVGNGGENYEAGTADESKVNNAFFFFFDEKDNCIDIQKPDVSKIQYTSNNSFSNNNPFIEKFGTIELRLKAGLDYKQVAVVLNSPKKEAVNYQDEITCLADLENRYDDYVAAAKETGQVMSNSVYYDMKSADNEPDGTILPVDDKKVILVPITKDNIYTSAERPNIEQLIKDGRKKYVDIFVERVVARIDVEPLVFDESKFYVYKEGNTEVKEITIYDHANLTSRKATIRPELLGMCLNVLSPASKLIKSIPIPTKFGYATSSSTTDQYKPFQWNDPANKRCYWESTGFLSDINKDIKYYSWNQAKEKGNKRISEYVHPLTSAWEPNETNLGNSLNTKIMVVAQLFEYDESGNKVMETVDGAQVPKVLNLVRYGADYMEESGMLAHAANLINGAVRKIDWAYLKLNDVPLTTKQVDDVNTAVNNAFVINETTKSGVTGADLELGLLNKKDNTGNTLNVYWEAAVSFIKTGEDRKYTYTITLPDELQSLNGDVVKKVEETINGTLGTINEQPILYWKGGKTYYYTKIRQQGFKGLPGADGGVSDFLYGVVRNHIYQVTLTGVYGFGTPVIDENEEINPDRPGNTPPTYISAKINILPWRVVKQSATIH